jgi:hypothetical protein
MSSFGKVFVYDQDAKHLNKAFERLQSKGFSVFGTDNIYRLLRYAEKVLPDVVIMNVPENFRADQATWQKIHDSLCRCQCPQVYTNAADYFESDPSFHAYDFSSADMSEDQILEILENLPKPKYLQ